MIIDSWVTKQAIAIEFGLTESEALHMKNILLEECRIDTRSISEKDLLQIIETAKRFAEENE